MAFSTLSIALSTCKACDKWWLASARSHRTSARSLRIFCAPTFPAVIDSLSFATCDLSSSRVFLAVALDAVASRSDFFLSCTLERFILALASLIYAFFADRTKSRLASCSALSLSLISLFMPVLHQASHVSPAGCLKEIIPQLLSQHLIKIVSVREYHS